MEDDKFIEDEISFEFESLLQKYILTQSQLLVEQSIPINTRPSILDHSFSDLVKMDILDVKKALIEEISSLELESNEVKDRQLQKIFTRLFSFQPSNTLLDFNKTETRFYIDLISTSEIYNNKYIREFLNNKFYIVSGDITDQFKYLFLNKLYSYYDSHLEDSCDKLNYILRSSNNVSFELVSDCTIDLDSFFSDKIMSSFDKEELSQLFRFYFNASRSGELLKLFSNDKSLYMISEMTKMVKDITGHGSEFLYSALNILNREVNFERTLESFYDEFRNSDLSGVEVRELINYIISYSYDLTTISGQEKICDVDSFMSVILASRERSHYRIFKEGSLSKIRNNSFDLDNDFKEIDSQSLLLDFKKAILFNIYGIDLINAGVLVKQYGSYIDTLEECILEEDKTTLEVLKTIKEIVDLDISSVDFREKLNILQVAYFDFVSKKGLDSKNSIASVVILEGLCSRMIMHTYNERLLNSSNCKVIGEDRGVTLLDASVNFDIVLTALGAVGDFFGDYENFANKWNTSQLSENQGLCVSHISNQNIGVINYASPFLGFSYIPEEGLNTMGPYDIYSHVATFNLRRDNNKLNRLFVPASIMSDETRFGYNELLIDRFLMNDSNGNLKIQPSYVVFFKVGDTDDNKLRYNQSLAIAKDLNIPILIVDVPKVKKHERDVIESKEKELFSSNNPSLLEEIVTRYMNNYTGSLSLKGTGYGNYPEDFSKSGMRNLFEGVIEKINSMEDDESRKEWCDVLKSIYYKEKEKYDTARKILLYENSVDRFVLDELGLGEAVHDIESGKDKFFITDMVLDFEEDILVDVDLDDIIYSDPEIFPNMEMSDGRMGIFFSGDNYTSSVKVIVDFINLVNSGSSFSIENSMYRDTSGTIIHMDIVEDTDLLLIENLSLVYFTEDLSKIPTVELQCLSVDKLCNFKLDSSFDFVSSVKNSEYDSFLTTSGRVLASGRIDDYIEKIEGIKDEEFIKVFKPMIDDIVKKENSSFEELSLKLLDKKHNMRDNFIRLRKVYYDTDSNDLNKGKR